MFLFKSKKKKRSNDQEGSNVNSDIYVKNDHLLNIKLPDNFSSIVLPQLIGYEQDENGNTTAVIEDNQHRHTTPLCREGWYPVTRFIGSESSRGTLVDTTNITAASLVQVDKRLSVSFSSSYGDTLTYHSKEDSDNDHSACSDLLIDHPPLPASPFSNADSACIDRSFQPVPHLRWDRPKFKRNHSRYKVLLEMNESTTTVTTAIIDSSQSISTTSALSSSSTTSSSLFPRCISPATLVDDDATILTTDAPCRLPISKPEHTEKKLTPPTAIPLTMKNKIKPSSESSLLKPRQLKRHSVAETPVGDGSMIPRRPTFQDTKKAPVTLQPSQQGRKQSLSSGSRIPVRAQTMKV